MAKLMLAVALADIPVHGVKAGQILQAEPAAIEAQAKLGQVDTHKDALAYAKSQGLEPVRSAIELAAEQAGAARNALLVEIAQIEDLAAKAEGETQAALNQQLQSKRDELAALA